MVAYLSSGGRSAVSRRWLVLTERSVNKSYSYLLHGCRRKTFWVKPRAMHWTLWSA